MGTFKKASVCEFSNKSMRLVYSTAVELLAISVNKFCCTFVSRCSRIYLHSVTHSLYSCFICLSTLSDDTSSFSFLICSRSCLFSILSFLRRDYCSFPTILLYFLDRSGLWPFESISSCDYMSTILGLTMLGMLEIVRRGNGSSGIKSSLSSSKKDES